MINIQAGQIWRHYNGNLYEIVTKGLYEPTMEWMVVYRNAESKTDIWIRNITDFLGYSIHSIKRNGEMLFESKKRFEFVANSEDELKKSKKEAFNRRDPNFM
jgi:hypothetical protein